MPLCETHMMTITIGVFGRVNIALTCWVNEGSIFILIRVARALAKTEMTQTPK